MIDLKEEFDKDLDLGNFRLTEVAPADTVEGNIRLDIQPDVAPQQGMNKMQKMSLFNRIPVTLTLEVASAHISLAELMTLNGDSVIELDKMAGEPLDIKVNGILFGKAEVVMLNDKYGLRVIEFNTKDLSELAS
ncbi:flagellar motor switch protein FliN [Enterobacter ludwigii]|uniref:flagellar motor switch protein FliN n=1 Tax=Enterobacter ludwigii TaxID=299767 RepID=UPI003F71336A